MRRESRKWKEDTAAVEDREVVKREVRSVSDGIIDEGYKVEARMADVNREIRKTKRTVIQEKMITVYGKIELEEGEKKFLELGPEFALLEDINLEDVKKDILIALTKVRWGRLGKDTEEVKRYRDKEEVEEEERIDMYQTWIGRSLM